MQQSFPKYLELSNNSFINIAAFSELWMVRRTIEQKQGPAQKKYIIRGRDFINSEVRNLEFYDTQEEALIILNRLRKLISI